jgi:hypothetical protein
VLQLLFLLLFLLLQLVLLLLLSLVLLFFVLLLDLRDDADRESLLRLLLLASLLGHNGLLRHQGLGLLHLFFDLLI